MVYQYPDKFVVHMHWESTDVIFLIIFNVNSQGLCEFMSEIPSR